MIPQPQLKDITNAAISALQANQNPRALELSCIGMQNPQAGHLQRLVFARALERTVVPALVPQLKKHLESILGLKDIENQRLFPGWYYIFKTLPLFEPLRGEKFNWEEMQPALQDKFLQEGLKNLSFMDWPLELIFTKLRRDLLLEYFPEGKLKTRNLPFLCALAEHCFSSEYVFAQSDAEILAIDKMRPEDPISIALIGCYRPLSDITFDEKISAVSAFRSMIRKQVLNVRYEQSIKDTFEHNKKISGDVSLNVQAMYEENPYPRWTSINVPHTQVKDIEADILLAGCGTGQSGVTFTSALPGSRFTGLDISRTSLAYAARMAQEHGRKNIGFVHLDIMDAESLGRSFDYIKCSGVLHHMAQPEEGWRRLAACLKEGGGMQVAMYSARTRHEINDIRDYIERQGYRPMPDDIRRLRVEIGELPEGNPIRETLRIRDFYSVSMVRDLMFHIQEQSYNIPDLEDMMDRLGLSFDGFKLHEAALAAYRQRFPDDQSMTNLKNWHVFEEENPETFIGMYVIYCHKKGEIVSDSVKRIWEIQA